MKKIILPILLFTSICVLKAQEYNKFDTNKKRHGIWKKKFNNGRIRYQGEFNHGKEIGVFKFYSATNSDHPIIIKKFNATNHIATIEFFKNGKLESQGKMNGKKRIDKWLYYHKDGKTIMQEESYVNNKLDGDYKTFFPNKKPTIITSYKNGKLHGNYKRYSINNFVYQELNYINGKLEGEGIYYDRKTGLIIEKGNYKNDQRVGSWDIYIEGKFSHSEETIIKPKLKRN